MGVNHCPNTTVIDEEELLNAIKKYINPLNEDIARLKLLNEIGSTPTVITNERWYGDQVKI